jgi:hypothetical protein
MHDRRHYGTNLLENYLSVFPMGPRIDLEDWPRLQTMVMATSLTIPSSGLADRDIFRTAPDHHAALLVGDGQALEDFSTHISAPLDSGYAPHGMDMQLQSAFADDAWITDTDELMAFST